jgi:hypothetical protein
MSVPQQTGPVWGGDSITTAILSGIAAPPPNKTIANFSLVWNAGILQAIKFYDSGGNLLFTLALTWNPDGSLANVARQ